MSSSIASQNSSPSSPGVAPEPLPVPRCCEKHSDWAELVHHLIDRFPEVPAADVIQHVTRAKDAVAAFALPPQDELETGEMIARHGLLLATGKVADAARLDPESHAPRRVIEVDAGVSLAAR